MIEMIKKLIPLSPEGASGTFAALRKDGTGKMRKMLIILSLVGLINTNIYAQSGWNFLISESGTGFSSMHFINELTGYAGKKYVSSNAVLKTTNGGLNWFLPSAQVSNCDPESIYFINSNTGFIVEYDDFAQENPRIFRTTTSGTAWTSSVLHSAPYGYYDVCFTDNNTGFIVGRYGVILKSTNTGANWFSLSSGVSNNLYKMCFLNSLTGYVSGSGGLIIKTTNGGINWIQLITNEQTNLVGIDFIDVNTGFSVGHDAFVSKTITKTTNGGLNWTTQSYPQNLTGFHAVQMISNDTVFVTGGANYAFSQVTLRSIDGGLNWERQELPVTGAWGRNVQFLNGQTGFIAGGGGAVFVAKTTVGGVGVPNAPYELKRNLFPPFVRLSWRDNSVIEDNFVIQRRCCGDTVWNDIDTVARDTVKYRDVNVKNQTVYEYRVYAINNYGRSAYSNIVSVLTSLAALNTVPLSFSLHQNYPNPFNPSTKIKFDIPKGTLVRLRVYDMLGREVAELVNEKLAAGVYEYEWNGVGLPSGVYFYRLSASGEESEFIETRRMVLIK